MTPGQRRALWICIFGMAFNFLYEARGMGLIRDDVITQELKGEALRAYFWGQAGYAAAFLVLGTLISVLVPSKAAKEGQAPYHFLDWAALSAALAVLAGVCWNSYRIVMS
jgi:hypothetical protein